MKIKIIATVFLLSITILIRAQKPETVYSIAKVSKPHSWYIEQAELWWKETRKNPKNEEAWFNYFKACRMAKISARNPTDWKSVDWTKESAFLKEGDDIIKLADQNIPDTFTSNFIKWWNNGSDPAMFKYLKRAHELNPESPEMYDDLVTYYETQLNAELRKSYNAEWFKLNDLSPGLLAISYNNLVTATPGSMIITGGDGDTYPAWMLQDVQGIGKDVQVINLYLLNLEEYRNAIFRRNKIPLMPQLNNDGSTTDNNIKILDHLIKNKPSGLKTYLSMALWKGYYSGFEDKLYIVGNLLLYSEKPVSNLVLLEENLFEKYALDYLRVDFSNDVSREIVYQMNMNYLPGIIKLYEHFKVVNNLNKALKMKELALLIASKSGDQCVKWVNEAFK